MAASPSLRSQNYREIPARGRLSMRLLGLLLLALVSSTLVAQIPFALGYRQICLEQRFAAGRLIALAGPVAGYPLLEQAGLLGVQVEGEDLLGSSPQADIEHRLDDLQPLALLKGGLSRVFEDRQWVIRLQGPGPDGRRLTVWLSDGPVDREVVDWTRRTLFFSLGVAGVTALALYLLLQWLVVGSIRCITRSLLVFRTDPLEGGQALQPCRRQDELGFIERELYRMQEQLLAALDQQAKLAALGAMVSRINHDLKSLLSTVSLAAGRLARVDDPTVGRIAPLLIDAVERALHLCTETQDLARGERTVPQCSRFALAPLVTEVGQALTAVGDASFHWYNRVSPAQEVVADRDRLYRVLLNLGRNALEAGARHVTIGARQGAGQIHLEVADDGPGIPPSLGRKLFHPFAGARAGGIGLGLVTARDLIRAHGGELELAESGSRGTRFSIILPGR